jgi:hypothetical protein
VAGGRSWENAPPLSQLYGGDSARYLIGAAAAPGMTEKTHRIFGVRVAERARMALPGKRSLLSIN